MRHQIQRRRGECLTILTLLLLVFFLLAIIGSVNSCAERGKREAEIAAREAEAMRSVTMVTDRQEYEASINDRKALLPGWYRARFKPWSADLGSLDKMNTLLKTMCLLGLFLYPIWIVLFDRVFPSDSKPSSGAELATLVVGLTAGIYLLIYILSLVFYAIIYIVLSFFNSEDYYVPSGFISYCMHATAHTMCLAMVASWVFGEISQASDPNAASKQRTPSIPSTRTWPGAGRRTLHAMGRAFLVSIGTGCGTQIGGWVGGVIVFVIASGLASITDIAILKPVKN